MSEPAREPFKDTPCYYFNENFYNLKKIYQIWNVKYSTWFWKKTFLQIHERDSLGQQNKKIKNENMIRNYVTQTVDCKQVKETSNVLRISYSYSNM